jgi:hypothetical protein
MMTLSQFINKQIFPMTNLDFLYLSSLGSERTKIQESTFWIKRKNSGPSNSAPFCER